MERTEKKILIPLFLIFFAIVVLRNAWVCDDAYISFRVIDNFVNGYGLTWNICERVQAFTNPLWVFVLIPIYAITGEIHLTVITVSVVISLIVMALLLIKVTDSYKGAIFAILVLTLSNAFIDFSTSGLENPLSHLILISFFIIYFKSPHDSKTLLVLTLLTSMAMLNRLDSVLFYIPALAFVLFQNFNRKSVKIVLIGLLPIIAWETFSIIYYGFPFPNTAYAKLGTGLPVSLIWKQGVLYFLISLKHDPLTLLIITSGIILPISTKDKKALPVIAGLLLVLAYIVRIGGCFMAGRLFAAPLLLSVFIIARHFSKLPNLAVYSIFVAILLLGFTQDSNPFSTKLLQEQELSDQILGYGIYNEKSFYIDGMGLINYNPDPLAWPMCSGINVSRILQNNKAEKVCVGSIGTLGYYVGPEIYVIDRNGLTDALLARLPAYKKTYFRIGHFTRPLPVGYYYTVGTDTNLIYNKDLAQFYDKMAIITQRNIWSWKRFQTIIAMNLGSYNYLLDDFNRYSPEHVSGDFLSDKAPDWCRWDQYDNIILHPPGLTVEFDSINYCQALSFGRDNNDTYIVSLLHNDSILTTITIPPVDYSMEGIKDTIINIPEEVKKTGFNMVNIYPEQGDGMFSISHLIPVAQDSIPQPLN